MLRVGVAQWCLDRTGVDALYRAKALGFSAIQLDAGEPGGAPCIGRPSIQREYQQAAADTGIEITAVAVNVLTSYGLNHPLNSDHSKKSLDFIRQAADAAACMNISLVMIPSFEEGEIRSEQDLLRTAEHLRQACLYSSARGVSVATENNLGVSGNQRLLAAAAHPALNVLIDLYNPVIWGHRTADLIRSLWPHMSNQVHAKDGVGGEMGNAALNTGQGNFLESARALQEVGFEGYLILENEYGSHTEELVAQDLATISSFWG